MKVPSQYLVDMLKADALKSKPAQIELGRHLDNLQAEFAALQTSYIALSAVVKAHIAAGGGGGTTLHTGVTSVNFGAFPGKTDASVAVIGQATIAAGSTVQAWLAPVATADHTADEHLVDGPIVMAGLIVPGVGFTIYARQALQVPPANDDRLQAMSKYVNGAPNVTGAQSGFVFTGNTPLCYGLWTVAWAWS